MRFDSSIRASFSSFVITNSMEMIWGTSKLVFRSSGAGEVLREPGAQGNRLAYVDDRAFLVFHDVDIQASQGSGICRIPWIHPSFFFRGFPLACRERLLQVCARICLAARDGLRGAFRHDPPAGLARLQARGR